MTNQPQGHLVELHKWDVNKYIQNSIPRTQTRYITHVFHIHLINTCVASPYKLLVQCELSERLQAMPNRGAWVRNQTDK